jgi:hypothetical protein
VRNRNAGELTVAAQNLHRFFDDVNDPAISDSQENSTSTASTRTSWPRSRCTFRTVLNAPRHPRGRGGREPARARRPGGAHRDRRSDARLLAHLLEGNDIGGIDIGFLLRDSVALTSLTQFDPDVLFSFPGSPTAPLNDRPPLVLRAEYVGKAPRSR